MKKLSENKKKNSNSSDIKVIVLSVDYEFIFDKIFKSVKKADKKTDLHMLPGIKYFYSTISDELVVFALYESSRTSEFMSSFNSILESLQNPNITLLTLTTSGTLSDSYPIGSFFNINDIADIQSSILGNELFYTPKTGVYDPVDSEYHDRFYDYLKNKDLVKSNGAALNFRRCVTLSESTAFHILGFKIIDKDVCSIIAAFDSWKYKKTKTIIRNKFSLSVVCEELYNSSITTSTEELLKGNIKNLNSIIDSFIKFK